MIYLELVPRLIPQFTKESKWALDTFKSIDAINVPDVLRLETRSYEASILLSKQNCPTIPHIRAIDFSETALLNLCKKLIQHNINQLLLISGDPPPNPLQPVHQHDVPALIKTILNEYPQLKIYGACDPYRQDFQSEIQYCQEKIHAGAKGLFTQPLFNTQWTELLLEQCSSCEWFIGISPVVYEASYQYWITRNKVVFSPQFECSMDYNIKLAKDIMTICKEKNQHNYLMPIKANLSDYLNGIF